jgi:hypothetical protein
MLLPLKTASQRSFALLHSNRKNRLSLHGLANQLAMFRQRQWSDRLYGVVRLLHQ